MGQGAGDIYNAGSGTGGGGGGGDGGASVSVDDLYNLILGGCRTQVRKDDTGTYLVIDSTIKAYLIDANWITDTEDENFGGLKIRYMPENMDYNNYADDESDIPFLIVPLAGADKNGLITKEDWALIQIIPSLVGGITWLGSSDLGKTIDITNSSDTTLVSNAANAISQQLTPPRNVQTGDAFRNAFDGTLFIYEGGAYPNGHWVNMGGGFANVATAGNRNDPADLVTALGLVAGFLEGSKGKPALYDGSQVAFIHELYNGLIAVRAALNYTNSSYADWQAKGGSDGLGVVRGLRNARGYIEVADGTDDLPLLSPNENPQQAAQMRRGTMFSRDLIDYMGKLDTLISQFNDFKPSVFGGRLNYLTIVIHSGTTFNSNVTTSSDAARFPNSPTTPTPTALPTGRPFVDLNFLDVSQYPSGAGWYTTLNGLDTGTSPTARPPVGSKLSEYDAIIIRYVGGGTPVNQPLLLIDNYPRKQLRNPTIFYIINNMTMQWAVYFGTPNNDPSGNANVNPSLSNELPITNERAYQLAIYFDWIGYLQLSARLNG
jgi:hypothetical protein